MLIIQGTNAKTTTFDYRCDHPYEEVIIAVVGKYTQFEDSYMSVIKALKHSSLSVRRTLVINVCSFF